MKFQNFNSLSNFKFKINTTALHKAVIDGNEKVVDLLLKHPKIDVNLISIYYSILFISFRID